MNIATISTTSKTNNQNLEKHLREMFVVSNQLSDLIENILEEKGEYSADFIKGLRKSLSEVKSGKAAKMNSLKDLLS